MDCEIQKEDGDDDSLRNIALEFVTFYYNSLNSKSYNLIAPNLRNFTIFSSEKEKFIGSNIENLFNKYNLMNAKFTDIDFDTLNSGARRINILVTGTINYNNITQKFSEYIHCNRDRDNFWIQLSIFKLL